MTQLSLAHFVYAYFNIPQKDWKEHWELDQMRLKTKLREPVRRAYQAIYNSLDRG